MARTYQQGKKWGVRRSREHNGYIEEWCPLRKRYVYQHRLVMEAVLGRLLEPAEIVHHRNRDKQDNRVENLEHHESQSGHIQEHIATGGWGWPKGKPRGQRKPSVPCLVCDVLFKPKRRTMPDGSRKDTATCSQSCGQTLRYREC